jgi:hypothetical protein
MEQTERAGVACGDLWHMRRKMSSACAPRRSVRRQHLEHVADLQAPRRERRTTAGQAQQPFRQACGRVEDVGRPEDREGRCGGRAVHYRGDLRRRSSAPTMRRCSAGSFSSWHYCWYPAAVLLVHAAATEAMNCSLKAPPCFPTERENTIKICKTTPYQSVPPSQCTPCLPSPSGETSM